MQWFSGVRASVVIQKVMGLNPSLGQLVTGKLFLSTQQ